MKLPPRVVMQVTVVASQAWTQTSRFVEMASIRLMTRCTNKTIRQHNSARSHQKVVMHRLAAFSQAASVPVRLVGREVPVRVEELEVMSSPVETMNIVCV